MADSQTVKSNRDRYTERLRSRYPDKEYADDEALFGQINDDYDNYDKEIGTYKEHEKAFSDMFSNSPESAAFLTDWRNGEDPLVGMIRRFGDDFKAALEDPKKVDALAEANRQYAERVAKEKEYEDEYQSNIQETLSTIEQLQKSEGMSDDDVDRGMEFLLDIVRNGILGKFTPESLRMALKAVNHDGDVEQADREGEARGRNARISEKVRRASKGDGAPVLTGGSGRQAGSGNAMPELGAIDRNYGTRDIYERGGEKRTSYK